MDRQEATPHSKEVRYAPELEETSCIHDKM